MKPINQPHHQWIVAVWKLQESRHVIVCRDMDCVQDLPNFGKKTGASCNHLTNLCALTTLGGVSCTSVFHCVCVREIMTLEYLSVLDVWVDNTYSVTFLFKTPKFEWCVVWSGFKNGFSKDVCLN